MRGRSAVSALTVALLAFAGGCRFGPADRSESRQRPPTAAARRGEFAVTVEEVGVLRARSSLGLAAPLWGKLLEVAAEGTTVAKGAVVARLDTSDLERRLERVDADTRAAQSELEKAKGRIDLQREQAKLDLARSEAQLRFAERQLASAEAEAADADRQLALQLISAQSAEEKHRALRQQRLDTEQARLQNERKLEDTASQERRLGAGRQQAERQFARSRQRLESFQRELKSAVMRAPAAGTVFLPKTNVPGASEPRKVRVGDQVGPWFGPIVELPDLTTLEVRTQVDESLVARVGPGLPAVVRVSALKDAELTARVRSLGALAVPRSKSEGAGFGERQERALEQVVFPAVLELVDGRERLQPGLTVSVSYVLETLPDVVSVPGDAVLGGSSEPHVYVVDGDGWERRAVRLGPASRGRVVVVEGLAGDERVYLGDPRGSEGGAG